MAKLPRRTDDEERTELVAPGMCEHRISVDIWCAACDYARRVQTYKDLLRLRAENERGRATDEWLDLPGSASNGD